MGVGSAVSTAIVPAIDKLVEARYEPARAAVDRLLERQPGLTPQQPTDIFARRVPSCLTGPDRRFRNRPGSFALFPGNLYA